VDFDRADADRQHLRNLAVCVPYRHQAKNVTLPRCEKIGVDVFL
jgi:hypothetical protein